MNSKVNKNMRETPFALEFFHPFFLIVDIFHGIAQLSFGKPQMVAGGFSKVLCANSGKGADQ